MYMYAKKVILVIVITLNLIKVLKAGNFVRTTAEVYFYCKNLAH